MTDPDDIWNREALVDRFGEWPSFHDAEVLLLRLDRRGDLGQPGPRLELVVHLFQVVGLETDGKFRLTNHTAVTLLFAGMTNLDLDGFNAQNVLWDLEITKRPNAPAPEQTFAVELPTSHGLSASFSCAVVAVVGVESYEPGPESVYRTSERGTPDA